MKKRIALDMDEVLADVLPKFLDLFEAEFGRRPLEEEYRGKKVYQVEGAVHIRNHLFDKGFFGDLPVIEGSQEVVRKLNEHYQIYITTAAQEFRNSLEDKYDWLERYFPFLHWKQYVFCGDKSMINAEYMIDDHPHNLESFSGKGLLYTAFHNINETKFTRVNSWEEVKQFFEAELGHSL